MDEKENVSFAADYVAEFITNIIWVLVHIVPPLLFGKWFGIVTERVAFCLIIAVTSIKYIEAVKTAQEMAECVGDIIEKIEAKKEKLKND